MPVIISEKLVTRKVFTCSDGETFMNARRAFRHEMYLRIAEILPPSVIEYSKTFRGKRYHLSKHMFIRCGIYHIVLRDKEDLSTMNHFFKRLRDKLDYPDKDEFPIEFDIEIFYEEIPGVIMDSAQWRLYGDVTFSSGRHEEEDGEGSGGDGEKTEHGED